MVRQDLTEKLQAEKRKILRKILGPVKENDEYIRQKGTIQYKVRKITNTIRKRTAFYAPMSRMSLENLTNRIFANFLSKKTKGALVYLGGKVSARRWDHM